MLIVIEGGALDQLMSPASFDLRYERFANQACTCSLVCTHLYTFLDILLPLLIVRVKSFALLFGTPPLQLLAVTIPRIARIVSGQSLARHARL